MPRFSLKELLTAIAMVSLGFALMAVALRPSLVLDRHVDQFGVCIALIYLCGTSLTGAGVMYPFEKTAKGAWIGAVAAVPGFIVAALLYG